MWEEGAFFSGERRNCGARWVVGQGRVDFVEVSFGGEEGGRFDEEGKRWEWCVGGEEEERGEEGGVNGKEGFLRRGREGGSDETRCTIRQ